MATPYATVHLASTGSTQDEARRRYDGRPLLVTTDSQHAGRGRRGRSWRQAPRAVASSLAIEPSWPVDAWPRLTLVAGLAAADSLNAGVGLDWPNDLVVGSDKVGGLLAEAADGLVVFGLGVNLWWPDAPAGMAAISDDDPGAGVGSAVANRFATALLRRLAAPATEWGRAEFRERCVTIGERVVWEGGAGTAVDIADDGGLVVASPAGRHIVSTNEVHRMATVLAMRRDP